MPNPISKVYYYPPCNNWQ